MTYYYILIYVLEVLWNLINSTNNFGISELFAIASVLIY